ncbi:MAG: biotin carboxylase N-terminal domain-containing protein [Thermoprotei archaeon]
MTIRILIANRGEIVIRIARSIRELGYTPLGIYTDADKNSLHRQFVDEDYRVSSYLDIDDIIRAAEELGADAIHPGYGFLSENPEFARRVVEKGFIFIGPRPETMVLAGDKVGAKEAACKAGVPTLPWIVAEDPDDVVEFAREHGLPVMLKAAGGGGGMGIRIIKSEDRVEELFRQAQKEAENAFGDSRLYVEPYIERAKHIEVQILGDGDKVIHLYERDCSIQRRHQKIIEEAPAPTLTPGARKALLEDAVKLMESIGYSNAGTVEFIYDVKRGRHYFMEINARLQVEHTVTEMVTGIDIVKEQIRIALEGSLGIKQEDVILRGHAIEARINAENPITLLPSPGVIREYREPSGPGIRVDSGVSRGREVVTEYSPLVSKLIVWGINRSEALQRLRRALSEYVITGIQTNIPLVKAIIEHPVFTSGLHTTRFLEEYWSDIVSRIREREFIHAIVAVALAYSGGDKARKLVASKAYVEYTNGLLDTRIASIKRKAWVYWVTLRRRISRSRRR